jgi:hypothetical protein
MGDVVVFFPLREKSRQVLFGGVWKLWGCRGLFTVFKEATTFLYSITIDAHFFPRPPSSSANASSPHAPRHFKG